MLKKFLRRKFDSSVFAAKNYLYEGNKFLLLNKLFKESNIELTAEGVLLKLVHHLTWFVDNVLKLPQFPTAFEKAIAERGFSTVVSERIKAGTDMSSPYKPLIDFSPYELTNVPFAQRDYFYESEVTSTNELLFLNNEFFFTNSKFKTYFKKNEYFR